VIIGNIIIQSYSQCICCVKTETNSCSLFQVDFLPEIHDNFLTCFHRSQLCTSELSSCSSLFQSRGSRPRFLSQHSISQTSEFRFCSFSILWHSVELTFSLLSLANIKIRFCCFTGLYFPHLR